MFGIQCVSEENKSGMNDFHQNYKNHEKIRETLFRFQLHSLELLLF